MAPPKRLGNARATDTCNGDTVNLAARIGAHTKTAHCPILIDDQTHTALAGRVPASAIGAVQFKGKGAEVLIFAVVVGN
jgi:adenylate cyclase